MSTYGTTDMRDVLYAEDVRIGWFLLTVFAAVLGIEAAVITVVAIKGSLGGWEAILFYAALGLGMVVMLFLIINFTMLAISVAFGGIEFRYGLFAKQLEFDQIRSVQVKDYEWTRYGGWGLRFSTGGRRAWSMPFVKTGVVIEAEEDGKDREYYVSSRNPEELARVLNEHIPEGDGRRS